MTQDPSRFDHTRSVTIVHPHYVIALTTWVHADPDDLSAQEKELLAGADHFGLPVLWGLVDHDPVAALWSSLEFRPIIPGFHAIHISEA